MSETIAFPLPLGPNYTIPDVGDLNWGQSVTNFLVAIPNGVVPTQGTFTLTGDLSFGTSFGLITEYLKSTVSNPATAGILRLAKTDAIDWRNNANSGNNVLAVDGSDVLTYNGVAIPTVAGAVTSITGTANQVIASASTGAVTLSAPQDLATTSSPQFAALALHASAPTATTLSITNQGNILLNDTGANAINIHVPSTIVSSYIMQLPNAQGATGTFLKNDGTGVLSWASPAGSGTVNSGTTNQLAYYAGTGTTVSGLTAITASRALASNGSGLPIASATTDTELGYVNGVTSAIQTQLNSKLNLLGGTMSGAIAMGSNKITGLANGTNPQDAVTVSQLPTATVPTGSITMFGSTSAPSGWLVCDGSSYTTAGQPSLFAVIGYTFGGSGANFSVPNFTNNVPIGAGSIAAHGATAGSQTHVISGSELPTHNHSLTDGGHNHAPLGNGAGSAGAVKLEDPNADAMAALATVTSASYTNTAPGSSKAYINTATTGITVNNAGSSSAMSLVQPSLGITYIIKA